MTLHKQFNPPASFPYHGIVPFGNFTRPDGKRLFEFFWIRAKRWFEEQGIVKFVACSHLQMQQGHSLQDEAGRASAGTGTLLYDGSSHLPGRRTGVLKPGQYFSRDAVLCQERPVACEELRVPPAPFINQFPERPVNDCLANPGDLGKCHVQVVERKQALTIRGCA